MKEDQYLTQGQHIGPLNFFGQYCTVFTIQSFTSLVQFTPKYFILFEASVNGINIVLGNKVFFISLSNVSISVYK